MFAKISNGNLVRMVLGVLLMVILLSFAMVTSFTVDAESSVNQFYYLGGDLPTTRPFHLDSDGTHLINAIQTVDGTVADSVDLSATNYFPPIGKQEGNSCSAWTTTYYQFTYEVASSAGWDAKHDNSKVFSPKYVWNYLNGGGNNGLIKSHCYNFLQKQGAVKWMDFPQNDDDPSTETKEVLYDWYPSSSSALAQALQYRVTYYDDPSFAAVNLTAPVITGATDSDLQQMKTMLKAGHVLSISTDCNIWVRKQLSEDWNGEWAIIYGAGTIGAHGLTVVGFDDSIYYDLNNNGVQEAFEFGAFKIANSWGTDSWGTDALGNPDNKHNAGYIWLMYDALNEVSSASNLNVENRHLFIRSNKYWYIEVENVQPDLMVEVTLEHSVRNDISVKLGSYTNSTGTPTFLQQLGGPLDFDGLASGATGHGRKTRKFMFDYGNLYTDDTNEYWIEITDHEAGNGNTKVVSIRWLNGNGTTVYEISPQQQLNGTSKKYWWDDYGDTYTRATAVNLHSKTNGTIEISGDVDYFKFTPSTTGTYLFYTTGTTDTQGYLYNASQTQLTYNDDSGISGYNFAIKYYLTAGQTVHIRVKAYSTKTGAYEFNISRDFYSATLNDTNQDARRVQMQAEAATALTTLDLTIGNNTYTITRPSSGVYDNTFSDGTRIKVSFQSGNNGLSTTWIIQAKITPTTVGTTDTVTFAFSAGSISNVTKSLNGLVAYKSSVKTGVNDRATNSLQQLLNSMASSGYSLTVRNWDNTLVTVTSTTKAATGMKIIKTDSNNRIVEIFYVAVFGDVAGNGNVNLIGDGTANAVDTMEVLQYAVDKAEFVGLAVIAADANHDGTVDANDGMLINQHAVNKATINQNVTVTTVPDDCYFLDPVVFQ